MKQKFTRFLLLLGTLALLNSGCNEGSIDSPLSHLTFLNIRLVDAPLAIDEVNIDLQSILVKGPGGSEEIVLNTNAGIYNLLDLTNGIDALVASAMVSLNEIRQVRLILGEDNTVVVDGVEHDLKIPSGSQSGLKIQVCLDLTGMPQYDLILDFDAAASVFQNGNGQYRMHPVIKVVNPDASCGGNGNGNLQISSLPDDLQNYLLNNYDGYSFTARRDVLCGGMDVYNVTARDGNTRINLFFDLNGGFLQSSEDLDPMLLDADVQTTISNDYSAYDVIVESYLINRFDGEIRYEVSLKNSQNNERVYLVFDEDGGVLCEE
ncbi:MAG: DUF4382 domain-containing protein [Lewinellaceae bacterium]|nr:DUF4382 domain-containing protein [Lewinellaceae bacterium]MCB9290168.1 DUF4382 domain-containing protein [Lewinellaceae bacterium]